jgi:3-hydroxyacyl-[acyl-carrier-protein] dehydratase
LVDRLIDIVHGHSAVGVKNVTINEPQFNGHFPGYPVMPGVLIVEAMAQTAALVVVDFMGEKAEGKVVYFMTIDNARFRKPVIPGDTLLVHVEKVQSRGAVWKFKGTARVGDKVCAEATFSAMITETASEA